MYFVKKKRKKKKTEGKKKKKKFSFSKIKKNIFKTDATNISFKRMKHMYIKKIQFCHLCNTQKKNLTLVGLRDNADIVFIATYPLVL
jgi:mannitol-specific phosphotransferase system IIBC component